MESHRLERRLAVQRRLQRRSAEGNVLTSQIRGLDGDLAGRAEDLKGLVQDGELGKLRGEILERQERADPMLLHRAHRHGGGLFERLVNLISKSVGQDGVERAAEDDQDEGQRGPVPERETDA